MADKEYERIGNKIFNVAYYAKDELLEWLFFLYKNKLPKSRVIKKKDHLVVINGGCVMRVKPHGLKFGVY